MLWAGWNFGARKLLAPFPQDWHPSLSSPRPTSLNCCVPWGHFAIGRQAALERMLSNRKFEHQGVILFNGLDKPRLDFLQSGCLVFGERGQSGFLALGNQDNQPGKMVQCADFHAFKVVYARSNLLCGLSRKRDKRNLIGARDSGSYRVPSLSHHRVRFSGSGPGDDEGAIFLDHDRPPLFFV